MITASDLSFLKQVINKHLDSSAHRVFVFGSRALGTNRKFSDFDIGIEGSRLAASKYFDIVEDFEESNFPYKVDLVQICDLPNDRIESIKNKIIPLNF